ncbi:MAG: molybdate ABC transporter substrate-binding protein, partial [Chloroflexia bacterium]|nr:molybdate ABC transporter substrate-binding protein [Chloroflexia bacterium]
MKTILLSIMTMLSICLNAQTVRVAAAGNLRSILDEIKEKYVTAYPKVKIDVVLGASGALTQQILNGASFDIFMSADKIYPDKLKAQGAAAGEVKTYAFGKLVLWSNTLDVSKGIDMLLDKSVSRIAIAKPDVAPYGARAVECLKYYGIYEKVKDKLVYADNIAQAAQFAQSGNAEVAFLAQALVYAPDLKGKYVYLEPKSYKPVEQACVMLKSWERNPEAGKF